MTSIPLPKLESLFVPLNSVTSLEQLALEQIQAVFLRDSCREIPVVQSVSLFFWQNISRWARQIALVPEPFVIALSGPSGSGKSFIRETLVNQLAQVSEVSAFTQDNYYRDFELDFPHLPLSRFYDEIDLDDPAHIRFRHLERDLNRLREASLGSTVLLEKFRFGTPVSKPTVDPAGLPLKVFPFIVTEGIHAFHEPAILPLYDLKIYVDVDEQTRRTRWLERNRRENRGTTDNMWSTTVQCLEKHISPTRACADLVLNNLATQAEMAAFLEELVTLMTSAPLKLKRDIA